jgi:uncharacterized lipoprotein YmbA
MKKVLLIALIIALISCNSGEEKKSYSISASKAAPSTGADIPALYRHPGGHNDVAKVMRVIRKVPMVDTTNGVEWIRTDTIWGRPMKDTVTGGIFYNIIGKDSVYWHIEGKSIDSLIKNWKPAAK